MDALKATPPAHLKDRILAQVEAEPARVETDRNGAIITINPAFSALCGYSFAEVVGRKPGDFLQGPESDPAAVSAIRLALSKGAPCCVELVNYHKDTSPYRVRLEIAPLRGESGAVAGFKAVAVKLAP